MNAKIASFWDDFVDILFPRVCPGCGEPMTGSERQLCTACLISLPRVMPGGLTMTQLDFKFVAFPEVKSVQAFLEYEPKGRVQALLRSLKYEGNCELGVFLGRLCGSEWAAAGRIPDTGLLVPVPLHPRKLKERGYNQSEAFARGLSEVFSLPVDGSLLKRNVYTLSQTGKTKAGRISGMQGVFSVREGVDPAGLCVILLDDVLTTGATLEACAEELRKNGCREIHIITIAAARS